MSGSGSGSGSGSDSGSAAAVEAVLSVPALDLAAVAADAAIPSAAAEAVPVVVHSAHDDHDHSAHNDHNHNHDHHGSSSCGGDKTVTFAAKATAATTNNHDHSASAHVHGPSCSHDHHENDHKHNHVDKSAPGHVHGSSCSHDHDNGHDNNNHVDKPAAAHVHGASCSHDHDNGHDHKPVDKPAHVHGPSCSNDHQEHDHGHDHGHGHVDKPAAHVHGPSCSHDHDNGHDHNNHVDKSAAHVHGPSCSHDHQEHGHGHVDKPAHVHGPSCAHDHKPVDKPAHVHGASCSHDHHGHDHKPVDKPAHVDGASCSHDHHGHGHAAAAVVVPPLKQNDKNNKGMGGGLVVRSTFMCKGICCSSEIPAIMECLSPVDGITNILINVPLKHVIVDHLTKTVSATMVQGILNKHSFKATIMKDGDPAAAASKKKDGDSKGRSRFYVNGICCSSEIPVIKIIIESIGGGGISGHMINVTTKTVYVDHDSSIISANDIANALEAGGFHSIIEHDHSEAESGVISAFVTSRFIISSSTSKVLRTNSQLQGYVGKQMTIILDSINKNNNNNYDTRSSSSFIYTNTNTIIDTTNCDIDFKSMRATISHNAFLLSADDVATNVSEKLLLDDDIFYEYDTTISLKVQMDGNSIENKIWEFPSFDVAAKDHQSEDDTNKSIFCKLSTIITIISGVAWVISLFLILYQPLNYVGIVSVVLTFPPIAMKAFKSLRRYRFDVNVLMAVAMVGACALQDFMEAAAIGFLFSISDYLAHFTSKKARDALQKIVELKPESANLIHPQTKELILIPVESVPIGALVAVKSGDKVPCDGVVVEGTSTFDESSLTGESRPIQKRAGDDVSGGTVNSGNTQIIVQTTSNSEESAVSRLVKLVEEAQANRSETEQLVDRIANVYTPVILVAALCMLTIPWAFGVDVGKRWMNTALVLIVAACPCALVISTPVSYVAGLAAAAQKGVLVKGGAHLEALAAVQQIYFDKTGTLTEGNFKMLELDVLKSNANAAELDRTTILEYLYLMEERAAHPLSIALAEGAKKEGVNIQDNKYELTDHNFMAGEGVEAIINGMKVNVGNERLFRRLDMFDSLPESEKAKVQGWELMGATIGFMSIGDHGIVCSYCAADAVRPESKQVLAEFRKMGINIIMLTGDNRKTAIAIGTPIGLTEDMIKSGLLPAEKLDIVCKTTEEFEARGTSIFAKHFAKQKTVLMCGDGVNDAPALAAANIGVAMGHGAALAMSTADVCLLDSSLFKLVYALRMGKAVKAKIVQNVTFSIVVKIIVVVFALLGRLNLLWAIVSDIVGMVIVTANGMLLLTGNKTNEKKKANKTNEKKKAEFNITKTTSFD